jgi:hypothetical protein
MNRIEERSLDDVLNDDIDPTNKFYGRMSEDLRQVFTKYLANGKLQITKKFRELSRIIIQHTRAICTCIRCLDSRPTSMLMPSGMLFLVEK